MNVCKRILAACLAVLMITGGLTVFSAAAAGHYVQGDVTSYNPAISATATLTDGTDSYTAQVPAADGTGKVTGTFKIENVPDGTYDLIVEKEGHLSYTVSDVIVNGNLTLSGNTIELLPGDIDGNAFIDSLDVTALCFDIGKAAADTIYVYSDLDGNGFRDALDVTVLSFNLLKSATIADYVPVENDPEEEAPARVTTTLTRCDSEAGSWGIGFSLATSGAPEGSGYYKATDAANPQICARIATTNLTSHYANNGVISMKVYVDDVSKATSDFVLCLWTDDCDGSKTSNYTISKSSLQNGWNDVEIPLTAASPNNLDWNRVGVVHLIGYSASTLTIGLDDVTVTKDDDTVPIDPSQIQTLMLNNCDSAAGFWGEDAMEVKTENAAEGSGYVSTTLAQTKAPAIVICGTFTPNKDISDYQDFGTLSMDLFVDDPASLWLAGTGFAQFELYDANSKYLNWTIYDVPFESGWNEVNLDMSTAAGQNAFDYSSVCQFRVFIYLNSGTTATLGIDNIHVWRVLNENMQKTKALVNTDTASGWFGFSGLDSVTPVLHTTGAKEGTGYVTVTSSGTDTAAIGQFFSGGMDLSRYTDQGGIHFWIYVENSANFANFGPLWSMFEMVDTNNKNTSWTLYDKNFTDGWNEVYLPYTSCEVNEADLSSLSYFRLFQYTSGPITIGLDDLYAYASAFTHYTVNYVPDENTTGEAFAETDVQEDTRVTLPECDFTRTGYTFVGWSDGRGLFEVGYRYKVTEDVTMTAVFVPNEEAAGFSVTSFIKAQAAENSVLNYGAANNVAAIAKVMQKAEAGQPITLVVLGDSITQGAGAATGQAWADQFRKWWAQKFPSSTVTLVNSGIGSTEAQLGVSRTDKAVLAHNPDLVVVDFGTNDVGSVNALEAYEGIISKILSAGVPVINSNAGPRTGKNIQEQQIPVNQAYGVPQISFISAYYELSASENAAAGFSGDELWSSDNVHPSQLGHTMIAELLTTYLEGVYDDYKAGTVTPAAQSTVLPTPITANGYADSILFESTDAATPLCTVTKSGFTADYAVHQSYWNTVMDGWQSHNAGDTITFTTKAGYVTLFLAAQNTAGKAEISVDGTVTQTIVTGVGYEWYHYWIPVLHVNDGKTHTITVRAVSDNGAANVGITAVGLANFAD